MATDKLRKGVDEQLLEGGIGGAGSIGGRSATAKKVQSMTPQERAALENPGKQFETLSPTAERAMEKMRKAKESSDYKSSPELENVGEQFRVKTDGKKKGGMIRSASKRADGIASRGKTRGRIV